MQGRLLLFMHARKPHYHVIRNILVARAQISVVAARPGMKNGTGYFLL